MHKSLNENEFMYISIRWLHDLNAIVFYNGTSTYNLSCLVSLMFSISRCLLYQLWGYFKQKFIKLVAVIVYT
jgi:hypothetical protein